MQMLADAPTFTDIALAIRERMRAGFEPPMAFEYGRTRIPLNVPTYGADEVIEALDSMMSGWMTMGKKVKRFEEMWASYCGVEHGVMTNSGSSANLLALSSLLMPSGGEIITPALTWATTVFPIAQAGYVPALVDVDRDTYNLSLSAVEAAITDKTVAVMPVHLLGNPCNMRDLMGLADRHNLLVIEDACEAHGAEARYGQRVGSFGGLSTFSFFFSHHISTIEGGMVLTSDATLADRIRSRRAFGWIRDMSNKKSLAEERPDIDSRFFFQYPGYNFRPTEMQGAFGIHQLPRLEGFIAQRRENAAYWNHEFTRYGEVIECQSEQPNTRHVWFAYPMLVREGAPFTKKQMADYLEARGVETRPIEAGNMAIQPAMQQIKYRAGPLPNAQYIHDNAFFFGNHSGIGPAEREAIAGYVHEFMKEHGI